MQGGGDSERVAATAPLARSSPAHSVARILREYREIQRNPSPQWCANPLSHDEPYEWHFTLRGPPDSHFEGGLYHGRIVLPKNYPFAPPSVTLMTQNGRFEVNKKIRRRLAMQSVNWTCPVCKKSNRALVEEACAVRSEIMLVRGPAGRCGGFCLNAAPYLQALSVGNEVYCTSRLTPGKAGCELCFRHNVATKVPFNITRFCSPNVLVMKHILPCKLRSRVKQWTCMSSRCQGVSALFQNSSGSSHQQVPAEQPILTRSSEGVPTDGCGVISSAAASVSRAGAPGSESAPVRKTAAHLRNMFPVYAPRHLDCASRERPFIPCRSASACS